ncbi:Xaa-Pro aminopeptidase [Actinobacillus pleuropneumoniae]|uniref:Xaa-Pro aminopeptidase n=1 Tax=Actinobacillus pleuropneumoniae TaxID=715 RepID=A0A3S4Y0L6_ACTPL|nr:Xaa-Pro aminopeptidase [Actinobacillus pleuropneumoniae]EFL79065.1 Xaa-Pro aminopeptidase [Actinobacillus pleuropneumoniae serovar 2 str. 4226]MEE3618057.1 Xaa-Pro aminopeptidase [Actinobacillus pleuropneumoniae]UKH08926.1 Xaa-Pro aminopeptidase [Actinobacillus pleuropneumoniae]UKH45367.1 Xaa-Pro aminopeptidase [Actinobacillus pleuropneumoniae serovar 2 str. S1536]VEJ16617.1 Xaa-Pro aminopeptidase [Actinobacillus pleuropneumoniae]
MDLAYLAELPREEFVERRNRVFEQMQDNSALVVFTETEKRRNSDCDYLFRPDSYFWYLTGFAEPKSALLLIKKDSKNESVIFLRKKDPLMETWNGRRLGIEKAPEALNVDLAFDIEDISRVFAEKTQNLTACYYAKGLQEWGDSVVAEQFVDVIDWQPMLSEMRLIKSTAEIALIQQACHISGLAHIRAMKQTRPNRYELEIEGEIQHEFTRFGARFPAYNSIVASGENACILHYNENDQVLKDGDLLLIDAGAEFAHYAGDITRTFPINGKFSEPQREIYQLVLDAMKEAAKWLVPQGSIKIANEKAVQVLTEGLVRLGILKGEVEQLIADKAYRQFYMHGLGHWLGLDVHDVGNYGTERDRALEIGMVLTLEPGLYISSEADVPERYKGIGVRIEDNLLITEYGNKNLTSGCPKEIADIEAIMNVR